MRLTERKRAAIAALQTANYRHLEDAASRARDLLDGGTSVESVQSILVAEGFSSAIALEAIDYLAGE